MNLQVGFWIWGLKRGVWFFAHPRGEVVFFALPPGAGLLPLNAET